METLAGKAPIYDFMGIDLEATGEGSARGTMLVTTQHYSQVNRMHGGLVFVVFDTVMGRAVRTLVPEDIDVATVDISMRFIRMVYEGELVVEAEVFHPGRRIMQVRAQAFESRGKLAATATGAFIVLGPHDE